METIVIYLKRVNPRIEYVFNHMFSFIEGLKISFVSDKDAILPKSKIIEYGKKKTIGHSFFLSARPEIFKHEFVNGDPESCYFNGHLAFFPTDDNNAVIPFDIVSLIFYFLSRIEEKYKSSDDEFGRFPAKNSLLFQYEKLDFPIVDYWIDYFLGRVLGLRIQKKYIFQPTIDIDFAWKYKNRGFLVSLGSVLNRLMRLDFKDLSQRVKVLMNMEPDPFDTHQQLEEFFQHKACKPIFFFLLGGIHKRDRNTPASNKSLRSLIKRLARQYKIGIHPSYKSSDDKAIMQSEIHQLRGILDEPVKRSRQHYLRFNVGSTYHELLSFGIEHEYSMGFHDYIGFRAGTGCSFRWYDLDQEYATALIVHPLLVMDVTLRDYMNLNPDEALHTCTNLIQQCKQNGLTFQLLIHNDTMSEFGPWIGWSKTFWQILNRAIKSQD